MNDPWDVKCVKQSNQYLSCMKLNGVPLLPPVLSKECRKEMQYYKLLAKEVEKRISQLKPYVIESESESSEDKTDAPELPESEQSYELAAEEIQANFNIDTAKATGDNGHVESTKLSPECTEITKVSNMTDSDSSSKNTSKFVIDLSLSINETGKSIQDDIRSQDKSPVEIPERDYESQPIADQRRPTTIDLNAKDTRKSKLQDKISFNFSISGESLTDPVTNLSLKHDGPSSLSSKSFTGSLNDIHTDSVKDSKTIPLTRQRSYTVLKPSPLLLAHLEVQSLNTGIEMTSISMSESLSNLSSANKKRRSWDLESAKVKWSSMALELKQKNIAKPSKINGVTKDSGNKTSVRKTAQSSPPRARSVAQERSKRIAPSPKSLHKSEPIQKPKMPSSPIRNSNTTKTPTSHKTTNENNDTAGKKTQLISESEDPATRVRELYEKIQKQQLIQMANLVEKQKREQMLLQQVFEEQNNLLFTQLKTICPKSPNEVKEAWIENVKDPADRGPVSLSQLINQKAPEANAFNSPVSSTLTESHNYINQCDSVLKKSRDITGGIKRPLTNPNVVQAREKPQSPKYNSEGSKTRTHSPSQRNTSRKLTYEASLSSDRDYDPILTDRTNDTMADLNVTFPSDHSEDGKVYNSGPSNVCAQDASGCQSSAATRAPAARAVERAVRSVEECKPNTINSFSNRTSRQSLFRPPTAQECAAASIIVAYAKGYLVRRLMRTERVQATVQTIKDALLCALQLHQEREGIRGADVDLHRRLIQQITAACYALHDTFVASSPAERCAMIAADRGRRRSLAARPSPRHHRPTDIMSQSHSGAFPARARRPPPALMTQSHHGNAHGMETSGNAIDV